MTRILVAIAEEDGTVLDRFIVVRPVGQDSTLANIVLSKELRDHIERKFEVEDEG